VGESWLDCVQDAQARSLHEATKISKEWWAGKYWTKYKAIQALKEVE